MALTPDFPCYNGWYKSLRTREGEPIAKNQPQFGLQSTTRLHEVGIASNPNQQVGVNTFPSLVHTARHTMESVLQKWLS